MVLPGQFLERSTLIPVANVVLEGLSHRGEKRPGVLILSPTPDEGGSMDHVVAAEVAWACAQAGHPTLRFNFRGVGGSQGQRGEGLLEDGEAALTVLAENTRSAAPVLVSIGASALLSLGLVKRHPGICGLAMVNPAGVEPTDLLQCERPVVGVIAEEDPRIPRAALAAALTESGGTLQIIPGTGPTYTRNLPEVGKAVVRFLQELPS